MDQLRPLSQFPPVARLFVGLFAALMLAVCMWAVWIFTVEKGEIDENNLPAYLSKQAPDKLTPEDEIAAIASDSEAVLAPIWDTLHAGEPVPLDSGEIDTMAEIAELTDGYDGVGDDDRGAFEIESHLRHNLGLAHVHVNGQTLLFFALGAVFLFTSVKPRTKKVVLWIFAVTVVVHAVGLTGEGYHWVFEDILSLSGLALLALIVYMCLMIFIDLARKPKVDAGQ